MDAKQIYGAYPYRLLYIAMGKMVYHRQTLASILTASRFLAGNNPGIQILFYTDRPEFARKYVSSFDFVEIRYLTKEEILEWRGTHDYLYRIKIRAIQESLKESVEKLCYLDGDTFIRNHPQELFQNIREDQVLMYIQEGQLENRLIRNWEPIRQLLPSLKLTLHQQPFPMYGHDSMWNAGVIGVCLSHTGLVDKVLELTDQYCSQARENFYHQDQLMFSLVFARFAHLAPASAYGVYHYCYYRQKENADPLLKRLFRAYPPGDLPAFLGALSRLSEKDIPADPVPLPLWKRIPVFFIKRRMGLIMALDRVRKSGRVMSFFDRGKRYE